MMWNVHFCWLNPYWPEKSMSKNCSISPCWWSNPNFCWSTPQICCPHFWWLHCSFWLNPNLRCVTLFLWWNPVIVNHLESPCVTDESSKSPFLNINHLKSPFLRLNCPFFAQLTPSTPSAIPHCNCSCFIASAPASSTSALQGWAWPGNWGVYDCSNPQKDRNV